MAKGKYAKRRFNQIAFYAKDYYSAGAPHGQEGQGERATRILEAQEALATAKRSRSKDRLARIQKAQEELSEAQA